jgi:hypothetical protein
MTFTQCVVYRSPGSFCASYCPRPNIRPRTRDSLVSLGPADNHRIAHLMTTDYSPDFTPAKANPPRAIELRTYTYPSPEMLAALHERFRDHTMKLFAKHSMENLIYWNPKDIENADRKLIYLLAHKSQEAAKESFGAFRKDADWLAAREASEKKAGGSLTEKEGGVVSEFFVGTEYSPLR